MIHILVFALALTGTALGQSDCSCQIPILQRAGCVSSPFRVDKRSCQFAGCCWDNSVFSLQRCYAKDSRYCLSGTGQRPSCLAMFPPLSCGFSSGRAECEALGCCYNPGFPPSCLVAASDTAFGTQPPLPQVSQWSQWSSCSTSCSPGFRTRTRQCHNSGSFFCTSSGFPLSDRMSCNNKLCQRWSEWSRAPCSATCGNVLTSLSRSCMGFGSVGPTLCHSSSASCRLAPCPIPVFRPPAVAWTPWSQWSACFPECAFGTRTRTRKCSSNGSPVEDSHCRTQFFDEQNSFGSENCNFDMCDSWTRWDPVSVCLETCGSTATRQLKRECLGAVPSSRPTAAFRRCSHTEESCNLAPCPVGAAVTNVPPLQPFPVSFKTTTTKPTQSSTKVVNVFEFTPPGRGVSTASAPTASGAATVTSQTDDLITVSWGDWRPWSGCSTTCGEGTNTRTRICLYDDGLEAPVDFCGFETDETVSCNEGTCDASPTATVAPTPSQTPQTVPTPTSTDFAFAETVWGTWREWSDCSATCDFGTRSRTRSCQYIDGIQAPDNFCETEKNQSQSCNKGPCDGDLSTTPALSAASTAQTDAFDKVSWGPWMDWTDCSVTCADGLRTRKRHCLYRDGIRAPDESCGTTRDEITSCNDGPCPTADPTTVQTSSAFPSTTLPFDQASWGIWREWSDCSVTCGSGIKTRTRLCQYSDGVTGPDFICGTAENASENISCDIGTCATTTTSPISTVTIATTTPISITAATADSTVASWGPWLHWSECSESCSPGFQIRNRICKSSDGQSAKGECEGSPIDQGECNVKFCPEWEEWMAEDCTVTCASDDGVPGIQVIRRQCKTVVPETAAEKCYVIAEICAADEPCPGEATPPTDVLTTATSTEKATPTESSTTKTSAQSSTPAPFRSGSDIWANWGDWSLCSTSCAPGIQSRARRCVSNVPPRFCVEGALESKECNTGLCTGWSQWQTQSCDQTCGEGGSQLRRRICLSGQSLDGTPEACYRKSQLCEQNPDCEVVGADPKLDILFLVDSTSHVDKCDEIEEEKGFTPPLKGKQLTNATAPTYTRMKKFMTDFVNGWRGISDDGTRIGIQLFSDLCSPKRKSNLHLKKPFNESNAMVAQYIDDLPYLCGEYWLDWALQCAIDPVMTTSFGDRDNVSNVVVVILSNAPTTSQPSERLLGRILQKIVGKGATVLSAAATPLGNLGPRTKKKYVENTRKLSCPKKRQDCSAYLGSIWDLENSQIVEKIKAALRDAGTI